MAREEGAKIRLHVDRALAAAGAVEVSGGQAHYLRNVMRRGPGDAVLLFNARDGEWRAVIEAASKAGVRLRLGERTRPPGGEAPLGLAFAPVKRARIDLMVEKACELGVTVLRPVLTQRTEARRVNVARLRAIAVEAAEQSGRLDVPEIHEPVPLSALLAGWPAGERLVHLDTGAAAPPLLSLGPGPGATLLIGPEGGFEDGERRLLADCPGVERASLGPTTLRAETAAIAALAIWRAGGGWGVPPPR